MSRNQIYLHFVFTPKRRQPIIDPRRERELFAYIMGIVENLGGKLIRINAALDHVHMLVRIPTTITPSSLIGTVKRASSIYIREINLFPHFPGWAREYSVFSVSPDGVESVKRYIASQKEHHGRVSFEDEWVGMLPPDERATWKMSYFDG